MKDLPRSIQRSLAPQLLGQGLLVLTTLEVHQPVVLPLPKLVLMELHRLSLLVRTGLLSQRLAYHQAR